MYDCGRLLKQLCDESDYVYPNVVRYYRMYSWDIKVSYRIFQKKQWRLWFYLNLKPKNPLPLMWTQIL